MFGAIAATGMPRCNSIRCFAKVAACAELPRAQVTANCGGRDLSRATSSLSGAAKACCCRRTASGASRNSLAMPMSRLHAGIGFGADRLHQSQRARQCIALRHDEVLPGLRREPALEMRREAADQRNALDAVRDEARRHPVDVMSGTLHQLDRGRIELFRVLDDEWREPAEFGWPRTVRPAHDRVGVAGEFVEQTPQQRGRRDAAVVSPQRLPERLATEPGSAAFIRERQSPAADAVLPAVDHRPTDAAGADHDNPAILSRMGADTGGLRVAGDRCMAERQASRARGGQFPRFGGAGEREAGIGPRQGLLAQPGLGEALPGGIDHRCKGRVQSKAEIGRSGGPLSKDIPGAIGEPRAAARAAAIDAQIEIGPEFTSAHALLLPESSPNWLNTREPRRDRARLSTHAYQRWRAWRRLWKPNAPALAIPASICGARRKSSTR